MPTRSYWSEYLDEMWKLRRVRYEPVRSVELPKPTLAQSYKAELERLMYEEYRQMKGDDRYATIPIKATRRPPSARQAWQEDLEYYGLTEDELPYGRWRLAGAGL